MNIIFFNHPDYLGYVSIPRYTELIANYMINRGHHVEVWSPGSFFFNLSKSKKIKKWLGYIDQYILFPFKMYNRLSKQPLDTLYVFTDHAQGPWVPVIKNRKHVIHCHDFLAQKSALGEIKENPTSWTGVLYQKLIYKGYSQGKNFISISERTKEDLHNLLKDIPSSSTVVYNSVSSNFIPTKASLARLKLEKILQINLNEGYILHVGGNQWYKNKMGVIEIYNVWRSKYNSELPLILVGEYPSEKILETYTASKYKNTIHVFEGIDDITLGLLYSGATTFLFPSLAEGFGWPIAEAMACGCPVITTNEAPMTEVAGHAASLIPRRPIECNAAIQWAIDSAHTLNQVVQMSPEQRVKVIERGFEQVKKFNREVILSKIEEIYLNIIGYSE